MEGRTGFEDGQANAAGHAGVPPKPKKKRRLTWLDPPIADKKPSLEGGWVSYVWRCESSLTFELLRARSPSLCFAILKALVGRLQRYRSTRVWCSMCSFRFLTAKDAKRYKTDLGTFSACLSQLNLASWRLTKFGPPELAARKAFPVRDLRGCIILRHFAAILTIDKIQPPGRMNLSQAVSDAEVRTNSLNLHTQQETNHLNQILDPIISGLEWTCPRQVSEDLHGCLFFTGCVGSASGKPGAEV